MRTVFRALQRESQYLQLVLIVGAMLVTLWGWLYFDLQRARQDVYSRNENELRNLALAFAKEIESSVKTIDVTLLDLREHWQGDTGAFALAVRKRQSYLERELAFQVGVIDANGVLRFSSLENPAKPLDLSDREHFRVHRNGSMDELFISKPLLGRVSKRWSIQFTRPIYDKNEHFSGVLVLSVSPEYFYRFYRSISLLPDSAITFVREDGEVLSRYPNPEQALGKMISASPFLEQLAPEAGLFRKVSQVDDVERFYAWRKIERYHLTVVVGHSFKGIMAPYREQRSRALLAGIGLSVLLLIVGYLKLLALSQGRRAAKRLAENEERWRLALEAAGDGVWDWDLSRNKVVFSLGWKAMLGHGREEIGDDLEEWKKRVHPDDMAAVVRDLAEHFDGKKNLYVNEHRVLCKDGSWKWILDRGMVMARGPNGEPLRMVGTHTDISSRKELEEMLTRLATADSLTGLPNRRAFMERLENEMARLRRFPESKASVAMADLDHFKKINDTHGHAVGDAALKHFADLLRSTARQSDVCGRLGGEEFAVLLTETDQESAELFARRLCSILRGTPLKYGDQVIAMTVSVGVAPLEGGVTRPEEALQRADQALYQAKRGGRDRVCLAPGAQ